MGELQWEKTAMYGKSPVDFVRSHRLCSTPRFQYLHRRPAAATHPRCRRSRSLPPPPPRKLLFAIVTVEAVALPCGAAATANASHVAAATTASRLPPVVLARPTRGLLPSPRRAQAAFPVVASSRGRGLLPSPGSVERLLPSRRAAPRAQPLVSAVVACLRASTGLLC
ncbi:hypothetical protein PR202_ga16776 [Eleusine coracana subsp. coracana]|uniref:Uncharacterized protein n=1 Tax=Eleusine coracana subsp. coracana TaxID=191504 RepID=A0AAV5CNL2_ELECO|nr:hypothetical protein PR202_ga16776 [Eleusine coracana subsp. coracana]